MKNKNIIQISSIIFFIGIILIIISWYYSYPIYMSSVNDLTFSQFFPLLWPGIIFSLIGIFLVGYYSRNKILHILCCFLCPILLYITTFFFSYIASSDCGTAKSNFFVFQKVGIDPHVVTYFEFPNYFILNDILHQAVGFDVKGVAFISFSLYGILIALFLYLIYSKLMEKNYQHLSFLLVIIYFIGMFSFLNYQWAPQTLALIYTLVLIFISTYLLSESSEFKWKFLIILIFSSLVFTHAFLSIIFLLFFGILTVKKKYLFPLFLLLTSIYIIYTLYHTIANFEQYVETFRQSIQGFGGEYTKYVSKSTGESEGIISQLISNFNRIRIPIIWIIVSVGTALLFFKRKFGFFLIALGLSGGFYLGVGIFYSVLGLRSFQILFIPMTIGMIFFISKWKKLTILVIFIILILAVFGPMRDAYNATQFQTDEEANACNFLANNATAEEPPRLAVNQVDYGYFTTIYSYLRNVYPTVIRPGELEFFNIFNRSMNKKDYVIYNSNLGKEIINSGITKDHLLNLLMELKMNNKIYDSGKTFIINGAFSKTKHQ